MPPTNFTSEAVRPPPRPSGGPEPHAGGEASGLSIQVLDTQRALLYLGTFFTLVVESRQTTEQDDP